MCYSAKHQRPRRRLMRSLRRAECMRLGVAEKVVPALAQASGTRYWSALDLRGFRAIQVKMLRRYVCHVASRRWRGISPARSESDALGAEHLGIGTDPLVGRRRGTVLALVRPHSKARLAKLTMRRGAKRRKTHPGLHHTSIDQGVRAGATDAQGARCSKRSPRQHHWMDAPPD